MYIKKQRRQKCFTSNNLYNIQYLCCQKWQVNKEKIWAVYFSAAPNIIELPHMVIAAYSNDDNNNILLYNPQ